MSRQSQPLSDFLASLATNKTFPLKDLEDYLRKKPPSKGQCLAALSTGMIKFQYDAQKYKETAVAIWVCTTRNLPQSLKECFQFFSSIMRSRLLLMIFNQDGKFALDEVLFFLEQPLEMMVRKTLELNYVDKLIQMIRDNNLPQHKFNEILFLFELLLLRKIQKFLQEPSLHDFMGFLKETLPKVKLERLGQKGDVLTFRSTALLRKEEASFDTYQLRLRGNKLTKELDKGNLPFWVVDAYMRVPKPLNLIPFRSKNVLDVYIFFCQAEVFASSPLIEQTDELITDDNFIEFFQKFLLFQQMGSSPYKFGCHNVKQTINVLTQRLQKQKQAYRKAITEEAIRRF